MANNRNDNGSGSSRQDAGKKGGQSQKSDGNFANDPKRASEAGKKGGENSRGGRSS